MAEAEAWAWLAELSGAQASFFGSVTGFLFGVCALVFGALFNFWLGRKRDARIRAEEADSVAAALYGEIVLMREELARTAKLVANIDAKNGEFDGHFLEKINLQEPLLYRALAGKVGILDPQVLLAIVTFHNNVQTVREWLPQLIKTDERDFSYSTLTVLEPAIDGIEKVLPTLNSIAAKMRVEPPTDRFDLGFAYAIMEKERDRFAS